MPESFSLKDKKGLVVGIANEHSIAWGCAHALHAAGAELAVTWLNDKARPFVEPLGRLLQSSIMLPLDVEKPEQMAALFDAIGTDWGRLDFLLHAIAFAPKRTCRGVWSTVRAMGLRAPWISRATLSRAWHALPHP